MKRLYIGLPVLTVAVALIISGCGEDAHEDVKKIVDKRTEESSKVTAPILSSQVQPAQETPARRKIDMAQVIRGAKVFQKNCAGCHGVNGEGAPNWKQRAADGKFKAPPVNGSGHTWHHPMKALKLTINNGTIKQGGSMPPWKGKLSEEEITDVIVWFQSKWPNELYNAWTKRDHGSRK